MSVCVCTYPYLHGRHKLDMFEWFILQNTKQNSFFPVVKYQSSEKIVQPCPTRLHIQAVINSFHLVVKYMACASKYGRVQLLLPALISRTHLHMVRHARESNYFSIACTWNLWFKKTQILWKFRCIHTSNWYELLNNSLIRNFHSTYTPVTTSTKNSIIKFHCSTGKFLSSRYHSNNVV